MKRLFQVLCVAVFINCASLIVQGQQRGDLVFEHFTKDQGLSNNAVRVLLQDSRGYLWIGTEDGLNRYDGFAFTSYRRDLFHDSSTSGYAVSALCEDRSGRLWIGTVGNGLGYYDFTTDSFTKIDSPELKNRTGKDSIIRSIYKSRDGVLWIGAATGLIRYDPESKRVFRYDQPDNMGAKAIVEDLSGTIWFISEYFLWALDKGSNAVTRIEAINTEGSTLHSFTNLLLHPSGLLYVATSKGVIAIDTATKRQIAQYLQSANGSGAESGYPVQGIALADEHTLWVSAVGAGLIRIDLQTEEIIQYKNNPKNPLSLSENNISVLYQDRSGILWIGNTSYGLDKLSPYRNRFLLYRNNPYDDNSLSNNYVRGICEDADGALWVATQYGGLNRFDRKTGVWTRYRHDTKNPFSLGNDKVWAVMEDRFKIMWIGTEGGGLQEFDRKNGRFIHSPFVPEQANVFVVFEDRKGSLWVATGQGIYVLSPDRKTSAFYSFSDIRLDKNDQFETIQAIFQDRNGDIWIGGDYSLVRLDSNAKPLAQYGAELGLKQAIIYITSLIEDDKGMLWITTKGMGIYRFDRELNKFIQISERNGLPNDNAYGIFEDRKGCFWISSDEGIAKYTPAMNSFRSFGMNDGLQDLEFNRRAVFQSRSGEIFFGGVKGLNSFFPDRIRDNEIAPLIIISKVQSAKSKIFNPISAEFKYSDSPFIIEYAAMDFNVPEQNRYAYKLDGIDDDWIQVGNRREVQYAGIPPGRYVFHVIAANSDGVWNDKGASIKITILPPPWRTWWAYLFYIAIAAGAIYGGMRLRLQTVNARNQMLEAKIAERTTEVVAQKNELAEANMRLQEMDRIKANFTAMLVHDLKSPLTVVRTTLSLFKNADRMSKEKLSEFIDTADRSIEKIVTLINDMLEVFRTETQEVKLNCSRIAPEPVICECVEEAQVSALSKQIMVKAVIDRNLPDINADSSKLCRVFSNLLSNAIKFTPKGGDITVEVKAIEGTGVESGLTFLFFRITDTGEGIPAAELPYIFDPYQQAAANKAKLGVGLGLAIVKRIVAAHGGNISVRSQLGVGTSFTIMLPACHSSNLEQVGTGKN